jgi:hypothetical protein
MKPLIEFSIEHWEALLKRATEDSPLYSRLKNAAKTGAGTIEVLCDPDEAEMLLQVAKHFCPDAVLEIEKEIRLAERLSG